MRNTVLAETFNGRKLAMSTKAIRATRSLPAMAMLRLRSTGVAFVLLAACSSQVATGNSQELCEEFRVLLSRRAGLGDFAVTGGQGDDGTQNLPGVDFDSDGVDDEVARFCPDSASIIPADPCTLQAKASSTGESFGLEEQRLYVIRFKSSYYVVAGRMTSERGPMTTEIYRLTGAGAQRICSYECDLKSECRANAR
jgi:hypothetical protein